MKPIRILAVVAKVSVLSLSLSVAALADGAELIEVDGQKFRYEQINRKVVVIPSGGGLSLVRSSRNRLPGCTDYEQGFDRLIQDVLDDCPALGRDQRDCDRSKRRFTESRTQAIKGAKQEWTAEFPKFEAFNTSRVAAAVAAKTSVRPSQVLVTDRATLAPRGFYAVNLVLGERSLARRASQADIGLPPMALRLSDRKITTEELDVACDLISGRASIEIEAFTSVSGDTSQEISARELWDTRERLRSTRFDGAASPVERSAIAGFHLGRVLQGAGLGAENADFSSVFLSALRLLVGPQAELVAYSSFDDFEGRHYSGSTEIKTSFVARFHE